MLFSRSRPRFVLLMVLLALATAAVAGDEATGTRVRSYRASVEGQAVPLALDRAFLQTTRWDLTGVALPARIEEVVTPGVDGVHVERWALTDDGHRARLVSRDLTIDGTVPSTWIGEAALPEESAALDRIGQAATVTYGDGEGALRVETRTLSRGWVRTPGGPHIASLRREEVLRETESGLELQEVRLRWVSPRIGTVALATISEGAARSLGAGHLPELGRLTVDGLSVLAASPEATLANARGYFPEFHLPIGERYSVGWEMGDGTTIDSLVPETVTTMADFMALDVWDLSGNTSLTEKHTTHVGTPPDSEAPLESCNQDCFGNGGECGYCSPRLDYMARVDTDPDNDQGDFDLTNAIFWNDGNDGPGGTPANPEQITVWLLAGAQHEGVSDFFSDAGEGRFCNDPDTGRTPVPNTVYPHRDGLGYYYTPGDFAESGVYDCEQNIYDTTCGDDNDLLGDGLNFAAACQVGGNDLSGTQSNTVVKAGTAILPSGHTFNVIANRQVISFCVYLTLSACQQGGPGVSQVNKFVTLFNAPHLENVARLDSDRDAANTADNYTTLEETNIGTGLFPPVSVTVTGTTSSSVSLSWDPGATDFVDRHRVYWGTEPGVLAFNSDTHPGQVSDPLTVGNTTATVTGLTSGTRYFFTVSSLESYTNPSTGAVVEFESPIFFTRETRDPDFDYPDAVGAVPGSDCFPAGEARNLTVTKLPGGDIEYCWDAVGGSCVDGYELLGSDDAGSDAGWASAADPGTNTCITLGAPDKVYYLSVADGPGGFGPWGHYDR